jgi:hypothetical protein
MPTLRRHPPTAGRPSGGAILDPVTAKEKLKAEIDRLSEAEAANAEIVLRRESGEGSRTIDEWGDLDALGEAASHDTMQMLDEEERAAGFAPLKREDLL